MFWAPLAGSWTPATASSRFFTSSVKPSTEPVLVTANRTPFKAGTPFEVSAPDSGKSTPILIVPLTALPVLEPPHAASAKLATASPASNFGHFIRVLLPNPVCNRVKPLKPEGVALYTTLLRTLQLDRPSSNTT